jgi:hypothetical protein
MVGEDNDQRLLIGIFEELAYALVHLLKVLEDELFTVLAVCPPGMLGIQIVPQLV